MCLGVHNCDRFAHQARLSDKGAAANPNLCITYYGNSVSAATDQTQVFDLYVRNPSCKRLGRRDPAMCNKSMDLTIILDSSGSMSDGWGQVMDFAGTIVAGLNVGENNSRVAVMHYNDVAHIDQHYNGHYANAAIQDTLEAMKTARTAARGSTQTHSALLLAHALQKQKHKHITGYRGTPDVASVILLVTDGQSDAPALTRVAAQALKDTGNTIYAVGVSDAVRYDELVAVASEPDDVFIVRTFGHLAELNDVADVVRGTSCP